MFIRLFVFPSEVLPCSYTSAENVTLQQHWHHIFQFNAVTSSHRTRCLVMHEFTAITIPYRNHIFVGDGIASYLDVEIHQL